MNALQKPRFEKMAKIGHKTKKNAILDFTRKVHRKNAKSEGPRNPFVPSGVLYDPLKFTISLSKKT